MPRNNFIPTRDYRQARSPAFYSPSPSNPLPLLAPSLSFSLLFSSFIIPYACRKCAPILPKFKLFRGTEQQRNFNSNLFLDKSEGTTSNLSQVFFHSVAQKSSSFAETSFRFQVLANPRSKSSLGTRLRPNTLRDNGCCSEIPRYVVISQAEEYRDCLGRANT